MQMRRPSFLGHPKVGHGIELAHGRNGRAERHTDHEHVSPAEDMIERRQPDEALVLAEGGSVPDSNEGGTDRAVGEDDAFALPASP